MRRDGPALRAALRPRRAHLLHAALQQARGAGAHGLRPARPAPAPRRRARRGRGGARSGARAASFNVVPRGTHHAAHGAAPGREDDRAGAASRWPTPAADLLWAAGVGRGPGRLRGLRALSSAWPTARRRGASWASRRATAAARRSWPSSATGIPAGRASRARLESGQATPRERARERRRPKVVPMPAGRAPESRSAGARRCGASGERLRPGASRCERELPRTARAGERERPARHAGARLLQAGANGLSWATLARAAARALLRVALRGDGRVRLRPAVRARRSGRSSSSSTPSGGGSRRAGIEHVPASGPGADRGQPLGRAALRRAHDQARGAPRAPGAPRVPHAGPRHVRAPARSWPRCWPSRGEVRANPENGERAAAAAASSSASSRRASRAWASASSERYKLARFGRGGFVRIALRTGAPIIPVRGGRRRGDPPRDREGRLGRPPARASRTSRSRPPSRRWGRSGLVPLPTKWSIDFARARCDLGAYGPEARRGPDPGEPALREVRSTIQRMIDGRLARRRSVWFG